MEATVAVPGCCGELVEGLLGDHDFLISCPVNLVSVVTVRLTEGRPGRIEVPPGKEKTRKAVGATLRYLGRAEAGARVEIVSSLPPGKGMGSSSADVCAAIAATALALGRRLDYAELARLAVSVEPTNSTFLPGLALFDHLQARFFRLLGPPPAMAVLAVDCGGEVDTLAFNRRPDLRELRRRARPLTSRALRLIGLGLRQADPRLVARGATLSAWANQRILPQPLFRPLLRWALARGAWGVNVAHSGTVAGVLLDPHRPDVERLVDELAASFPGIERVYWLQMVPGGVMAAGAGVRGGQTWD
ncbi:MAG: GHMP kinase [Clostridia bacterium]|jgi:L-threonine kinase|nr:GHMP kinase [Clostridia bacterium]MDH7572923.1 GHMP kinase [Clostridia bacterium]